MCKKLLQWLRNKIAGFILNSGSNDARERKLLAIVGDMISVCKSNIRSELKGFQAIDANYNDYGHIILCLSVDGRDYCHIINVGRKWKLKEYKELCERIEQYYGISPHYIDPPLGISAKHFIDRNL